MTKKAKEALMKMSREDLKRGAKILKLKGFGNKNKTQLVDMIMENKGKLSEGQFMAEDAILKIREALSLSTSGNIKKATKGLRNTPKSGRNQKSAQRLAEEALMDVRKATRKSKGKLELDKDVVARLKKKDKK